MIEIFSQAKLYITDAVGSSKGALYATAAFFAGIIIIGIIDWLVPSAEGDIGNLTSNRSDALKRMGVLTALAIGIHNFPEGMVTFTSALKNPSLGIAICIAIAIHNIPEGIATAMPIFYSEGKRGKAFLISFFSGITEPIGAIIGYLILRPFFNDKVFGILFGAIAGIMVFISIEELLPMAREYDKGKLTIIGFVAGMAVMALSLLLLM
jgi:ZIP family zinc transporter